MARRLSIPCRKCSALACSLELPNLEGPAALMLAPILRIAAAKIGVDLSASKSGNPLESIPPEALSEILAVSCAACASAENEISAVA